jgi:hypothetical protein
MLQQQPEPKEEEEEEEPEPTKTYAMKQGPIFLEGSDALNPSDKDFARMSTAMDGCVYLRSVKRSIVPKLRCITVPRHKKFTVGCKRMEARKAAYLLFQGSIPQGARLVHVTKNEDGTAMAESQCESPSEVCVNPCHLACRWFVRDSLDTRDELVRLIERQHLSKQAACNLMGISSSWGNECLRAGKRPSRLIEDLIREHAT